MSFKAGKSSSQYVDLGLTGPPSPAKQESPVTRACKAILNVQIWPSFDVDLEREYSKSMLTHRIKTTLFYGFIWTGCILTTVVRFRNDPAFPAHVIIAAAFLLSCIPMLGLLPIPLRCIKAMSWCLKQPGCVWLMALVQLTLFLICVLWMSTTLASESTSTTTTHFLVLWLMTIIGTSGLFDLWTFVMLLIGTNIALFCTHPMMDKTVHYFIQGLGSVATIIATVQHDLLVRKLFLQGKRESQFLARMSHEIRTPLNGVVGFLQELRKTVLSSEQFEFVSAMSVAAENLQQVTDDILDHLKQQAGKIVSSLQPEHLQTVISDCVKMFQGRAAQKSLALSWSVMDGVPNCMMLDRLRIQQMLGNLISNAIKFTDKGSIEVSASVSGMQNGSLELRMAVKDTGIGISAKQRDRLFTPFNQADGSITRRYGGTGIGLSLVKGFAELMGGTAGCTSAGGGTGSTFWFTVHTKEAQAPREVKPVLPLSVLACTLLSCAPPPPRPILHELIGGHSRRFVLVVVTLVGTLFQ